MKTKMNHTKTKIRFDFYRLLFLLLICTSSYSPFYGQTIENLGNGKYKFLSDFPSWDLHFWLFDDGYHSFSHEPVHYYSVENIPSNPTLYHTIPYDNDDDDVSEISLSSINEGTSVLNNINNNFENQIEIKRSWNLVNSQDNFFILMFENSQFTEPISGCVEFHFSVDDSYIITENILDNYGNGWVEDVELTISNYDGYTNKYVWQFQNLKPEEQRFIYIPANCLGAPLSHVYTRGVLKINGCSVTIDDKDIKDGSETGVNDSPIFTLRSTVTNDPHDPNYIESDPNCFTISNAISQTIRYKLVFQNEGIHASEDAIVEFSSNVPFESVELINSSDKCLLTWNNQKIDVKYNDVYIRGLNEDPSPLYDETIEWIELDVCYNVDEISDSNVECIDFQAKVFFDFQHPIFAINDICENPHCALTYGEGGSFAECNLMPEIQGYVNGEYETQKTTSNVESLINLNFSIYPTLVNDVIYIEFQNTRLVSKLFIKNILGETVIVKNNNESNRIQVDVSKLRSGVYFIQHILNNRIQTVSFVKK